MKYTDYFDDEFVKTIVVVRKTLVSDGMGGQTVTESTVVTFTGALWQNSANEVLASDRLGDVSTHTIAATPSDVSSVLASDVAVVDGKEYKITRVDDVLNLDDIAYMEAFLTE